MFDVDKLYTYMYATKEEFVNKERAIEIKDQLKVLLSKEAKEGRSQFKEILDYINEYELEENVLIGLQDRLNSIKSDNQLLKELKQELKDNTIVVRDNKFDLENQVLDVHFSLFENNSKELYQLVLSPNGFGDLKTGKSSGLAFEIDKIKQKTNTKGNYLNYLSAQYQMSAFYNGVSGKEGVGVFSATSQLCSITQNKDCRWVEYQKTHNSYFNNFSVRFGNKESQGDLSNPKAIGSEKFKSKVIEAFQSASVDNVKEQILYKLNINGATFNVINSLAMLGFEEDIICYFINQPIVDLYIKEKANRDSSLREFTEDFNANIFDSIINKIKEKHKIVDDLVKDSFYNVGLDDSVDGLGLKTMLDTAQKDRDQLYWAQQIAVLRKFEHMNEIGTKLQSFMQTVNAESKGFGKTAILAAEKGIKAENLDSVNNAINNEKSTSGIFNSMNTLRDKRGNSNSLSGFVIDYGLNELNKITKRYFPYEYSSIQGVFNALSRISGRKESSLTASEEFKTKMFTEIKSFIFSNPNLLGISEDPEKYRRKLFIDEWDKFQGGSTFEGTKDLDINKKPSLASIIKALQAEKFGKNNALISQFEINIKRDGTPSIIKYRASTGVNLDETELYQSFISMYLYDRQIPYKMQQVGKDGKLLMEEKSISTKELALELIRYNYLAGGVQGAIQFTRYIPVEVLMDLGFNKTLKNENFGYESLKLITDEFGNVIEGNVIEQIIQHNPKMLPIKIKTPFVVSESEAKKNGMRITESSEIDPNLSIVKKFRPYISTDSKKDEDNTGSRFITDAGFTPYTSVKIKDKWYLYKYDGEDGSYKLIPTLGVFGMSEYNYRLETGEVAKSAIDANNYFTDQHIVTKRPQMIGQNILEETNKNPIHELYDLNSYNKTSNPVETLLANIANNYDKDTDRRDYTARLAKKLLDNKFILDFSKHVRLKYETPQNGQTWWGVFRVTGTDEELAINDKVKMTKEEFELTSIHEIIHSITVFAFERMYDKNNKLLPKSEWESLPDNVTQSILKLDATRRALNYKFRQVDSFKEAFKKLDETKDLKRYAPSNKYEKFVYALVNNKEFIAEMFTSNDFMNLLNQVPAPSGNSFYTEILNILKRLIGLDVKDDIDTVFVGRVGMQVIEELNKFKQLGKSASNKQSNLDIKFAEELSLFNKLLDKGPTIIPVKQPAQQSKQTDIIDVIEKSNQIENVTDFEGRVGLLKLNKTDEGMPFVTFHVDGKRVNKISFTSFKRDQEAFKQAIRDEYKLPSEYESFSVGELNIYELSDNEQKLLIKRFGADAMGAYNNLSESEKESIIECLK